MLLAAVLLAVCAATFAYPARMHWTEWRNRRTFRRHPVHGQVINITEAAR